MLNEAAEMVREFQSNAGQSCSRIPCMVPKENVERRARWIKDELQEYINAQNIYEQADAITDLLYYLMGAYVEAGIDPDPLFLIIHNSNMRKIETEIKKDSDGKVLKPEEWMHPDQTIRRAIDDQVRQNSRYTVEVDKEESSILTHPSDDFIIEPQDIVKECANMPRPKGSKNKKSLVVVETVENIDEKIVAAESAIATLTEELKAKKVELKELTKAKVEAEKLVIEKKAEEEKVKLMEAVAASGKSIDEVISLLNGQQ